MKAAAAACFIISLFFTNPSVASASDGQFLYPGEELVYRVSYLNITLGTIRCVTEPATTYDGKTCSKVKIYINSHPNIPFISLHAIYESWMEQDARYSYKFNANTMGDDDKWYFDEYLFDYDKKLVTMEKYYDKKKIQTKSYSIKRKYNDGSSLLFAARSFLFSKKSYALPTVIMDDTVSTVINFTGAKEEVEIDAVEYPVKTVSFIGNANWTGIYGLTGKFRGWFSDDEARVPIKAEMSVYVGSVTIELQSWKRGTWQPPKQS